MCYIKSIKVVIADFVLDAAMLLYNINTGA